MAVIERAQKSDLEEILALQYLAYRSEAQLFDDPDIPPLRQTLAELEEEFDRGVVLRAADDSGRIIGSVRAFSENGSVYISKLMVHPDRQGQGLGTALLGAVERECAAGRYELFTSTRSVSNIRLYRRLGYVPFREEKINDELCFVYLEKKCSDDV